MKIWRMGEHILIEGDSTDGEVLSCLRERAGQKANASLVDPPYGQICAKWDKISNLAFPATLGQICDGVATCMVFCTLPYGFFVHAAMIDAGWKFRFDEVWSKHGGSPLVSKKQPIRTHEHLFAYSLMSAVVGSLTFNGYDAGDVGKVWSKGGSWSNDVYGMHHDLARRGRADGRRWIRSVLLARKKQELAGSERTTHPSQKPLELVQRLVVLLTEPGQSVYDGFLGSGQTLLACENTGRRCLAVEREPEYVAMAVARWEYLTGLRALRG